ncbi:molybdopterin-binding protein [Salinisphaera sp. Q1T1-3]|uniref:TOBE domain-containing protein n=1 Tax=Salinisphaera sp. Q1T1-3 TaxID=2321229 RepID=UPI000E758308|nr:TOBE domain-containing protein [Salinisphaera sp. Q1T1-3]RJS95138.1 transporter [Salinisphaera sp. Q1T1-3]
MSGHRINTRNQFRGRVIHIHAGAVMSEVEIETAAGVMSAVVTTSSLHAMGLRIGDPAVGLFKATQVLVGKVEDEHDVRTDT